MSKTNTPQVKIVNCTTGEEIVRDANAEEIAQMELDAANVEAKKQAEAQAAAQRQAILSRLGITEEEARILLGGN
jgi:hypothetical protein